MLLLVFVLHCLIEVFLSNNMCLCVCVCVFLRPQIHPVLEEFKKVKLTEAQQRAAMSAGNKSQSKQPVLQITDKGEKRQRGQATGAQQIIARGKNGGG